MSTFVSFYGHLLFYKATRNALPGYGLRAKFVCIILVLVLCGLQSGILETMGALQVIPCTPPFSVLARSQLIYHYCVIVEMFCIGLYARHTFRKVVPRLLEQETPCRRWQQEKAVQTDRVRPSGLTGASRRRSSSDSGDSLCRIEHEPLEGFCFPQNNRPEAATRSRGSGEIGLEETCITVRADITYEDCKDITVV